MSDILSDVLRSVRLAGAVFFDVHASSPWVAEAPPAAVVAPLVLAGSQHVMEYHVVTEGRVWATLADGGEAPVRLTPGSVILFPQGDGHTLSSSPGMRCKLDLSPFRQPQHLSPPFYIRQSGDGKESSRMLCGFIGCDLMPFNPIIRSLPRMVHVPEGYTAGDGWLSSLIKAIMKESSQRRVGAGSALAKLSELIFIEVVRSYIESLPAGATGWLAALGDRHVGSAIRLLHRDPKRAWTLEALARETGVSRTVLATRFSAHVGLPPMNYLGQWRMQLAARLLADGEENIARIAEEVGYESEPAFCRSFKRSTGISPGAWRHNLRDRAGPGRQGIALS